jgi:1-phosphofructokinase family hexose kinase
MNIFTLTPNPGVDRTLYVEAVSFNKILRATSTRLDWGGKGFNVSRALRTLGVESVALGFCGGGTGKMLEDGLRRTGVKTDFTQIRGETRTNTVINEVDTGRYVKVNEAGPTIQEDEIQAIYEKISQLAQPDDLWVVAGRLPLGVTDMFYADVIRLVQSLGGRVLFDASGEAFRLGCLEKPFLVKPNRDETEELTGQKITRPEDKMRAVRHFLDLGIACVAMSLGEEGLLVARQNEAYQAIPPQVEVRMDMGAGDSLLAGIIYAFSQNLPLDETAKWGAAVGTASVMREGVAEFDMADVNHLLSVIQVESLNQFPPFG